jgi:hypothetical protein
MITGKILVHGIALLLNFDPSFFHCYCDNKEQNCATSIQYYNGAYRHVVYLNNPVYKPISGEVAYTCQRINK